MALFARGVTRDPTPTPSWLLSTAASAPVPLPFLWGLLARPLISSLRLPPLPAPALKHSPGQRPCWMEPLKAHVNPHSPSTILVC